METMTKKDIDQILTSEGYKKVGFWDGLFFFERNRKRLEKLKHIYFNKGIGNTRKIAMVNPDAYKLDGRNYLLVTNSNLYIKQVNYEPTTVS